MNNSQSSRFETRAIHAGQPHEPVTGAVMPPVFMTSTYAQDAPGEPVGDYEYSRSGNPTRAALESNLASLESGARGLAFASGLAASHTLMALLEPGDHVVTGNDLYGGTYRIFRKVFERYGIKFTFVNTGDTSEVAAAMTDHTRYVYAETPSNPLLHLSDIAACAEIAHKGNALMVVDNTFATPYLQRPIELGADIVLHSLTKYLGGHSDVVAGALITRTEEVAEELAFHQNASGGVLGPMDSFLVLRGIKTLAVRMDRHCANALAVAKHLEASDHVERVHYPGLESHPQFDLCRRQMSAPGGMVSFELKGGVPAGVAFATSTKIFTLAESLGGVESLVETPPSMTHASIPSEVRQAAGLMDGLVRLSVGIEHEADLLTDVELALGAAAAV
ncbi:MAG TPA: cystathionine gamma-synthase [Planctomycetes bacterium]|nr:cystathionine gamma-synthase [Planctomycetota bacterium]HIL37130.1 cystathionine gamma-synthase [Planctomycetota bacterium]